MEESTLRRLAFVTIEGGSWKKVNVGRLPRKNGTEDDKMTFLLLRGTVIDNIKNKWIIFVRFTFTNNTQVVVTWLGRFGARFRCQIHQKKYYIIWLRNGQQFFVIVVVHFHFLPPLS